MEQETQTPHKRSVRYKGKYPRKFEENIKNLIRRNIRIRLSMSSEREIRLQECIFPSW